MHECCIFQRFTIHMKVFNFRRIDKAYWHRARTISSPLAVRLDEISIVSWFGWCLAVFGGCGPNGACHGPEKVLKVVVHEPSTPSADVGLFLDELSPHLVTTLLSTETEIDTFGCCDIRIGVIVKPTGKCLCWGKDTIGNGIRSLYSEDVCVNGRFGWLKATGLLGRVYKSTGGYRQTGRSSHLNHQTILPGLF